MISSRSSQSSIWVCFLSLDYSRPKERREKEKRIIDFAVVVVVVVAVVDYDVQYPLEHLESWEIREGLMN